MKHIEFYLRQRQTPSTFRHAGELAHGLPDAFFNVNIIIIIVVIIINIIIIIIYIYIICDLHKCDISMYNVYIYICYIVFQTFALILLHDSQALLPGMSFRLLPKLSQSHPNTLSSKRCLLQGGTIGKLLPGSSPSLAL